MKIPNAVHRQGNRRVYQRQEDELGPRQRAETQQHSHANRLAGEHHEDRHRDFRQGQRQGRHRQRAETDQVVTVTAEIKGEHPLEKEGQASDEKRDAQIKTLSFFRRVQSRSESLPGIEPVECPNDGGQKRGVNGHERKGHQQIVSRAPRHQQILPDQRAGPLEKPEPWQPYRMRLKGWGGYPALPGPQPFLAPTRAGAH